jgi:hypothetical protein
LNAIKPHIFTLVVAVWVGFASMCLLLQTFTPLGSEATNSARSWWTARRFQQADAEQDLLGLRDFGAAYLSRTGDGTLLDFAIYQIGFSASGPSMFRHPSDALDWALIGSEAGDSYLSVLPAPWPTLQTQAHILVERAFPLSHNPAHLANGLEALSQWMASGGGPNQASSLTSAGYREFLATALDDRPTYLLLRLSGESALESHESDR